LGVGGETVLHASAVELSGDAIAIVGGPGSGKSTVAAELCLAGTRLVTDDTLRVGIEDGTAYCHRGTSELRLRASAGALAERFPKETRRLSTDGRISVQVPDGSDPRPPIGAVIAPSIYRGAAKAKVSRLKPGDGFVRLVANP